MAIYINTQCPICGKQFRSCVNCQKHESNVCVDHCDSCEYLTRMNWNCIYIKENDRVRLIKEFYDKNPEAQKENAMLESTASATSN